jgi:hypothetical protein
VSEPKIDPEQLAALLDGRLDERQRAEVMARLAESPEAFEAYADAVAIVGEVERGSRADATVGTGAGSTDVIPLKTSDRTPSRLRVARWQWLAAAAVIAGVAVLPLMRRAGGPSAGELDPGTFVEALSNEDAGLPAGWNGRPWSTTRSAGDPLTAEARAVRIGAQLVDLELAVRAGDTAVVAEVAGEIAALLEPIPGSGPVASLFRGLSQQTAYRTEQPESLLERASEAATQLAGRDHVRLGALLEASRIAAARQDGGFFRSSETAAGLQTAAHLAPEAVVRASLERIRGLVAGGAEPDWTEMTRAVTALLARLGDQ